MVCSNGMVIGDMDSFKFVHKGEKIYQNIEKSYDKIVAKISEVKNKVDRLKNTILPQSEVQNILNTIAKKTFEVNLE